MLAQRLRSLLSTDRTGDGPDNPTLRSRSMAWMWGAGTVLLVATVALAHPAGENTTGILAIAGLAFPVAAAFGLLAPRISGALVEACTFVGLVLISGLVYFSGDDASFYALYYGWVILHASYFLPWRRVLLQGAAVAVLYGVTLRLIPGGGFHADRWAMVVGTVAILGTIMALTRQRVDALVRQRSAAARTDALTGLFNRRAFEERLEQEVNRAIRTDRPVCVLVGDLDHFKRVNDCMGHHAGDTVLERVGGILTDGTRIIDTLARVGGEEFVVILPESDEQGGFLAAERLRSAVRTAWDGQLTVSFGVASLPAHGTTAEEITRAGDQALYAAKELGRDRTVIHSPEVAGILAGAASSRDVQGQIQLATVLTLAEALDMRDAGTARHSETVGHYAEAMARELGLGPQDVERVRLAGILHDVGKIGVRDQVLMKPGRLTDEEYAEMKKHPEIGARIVASAHLDDIRSWVLAHHERPDGRGYPFGLADAEIPLEAKILAVADAYEAMTAERVYKAAMPPEAAREELRRCAGSQFDEGVVSAFLRLPDLLASSVEPQRAA